LRDEETVEMALTEKREAERDRKKEIPMNAAFNFSI